MNRLLDWVVAVGIAAIACMLIAQVFFRYVLNASLSWTEEVSTFTLIWVGIFGVASGLRTESFIAFTLFRTHRKAWLRGVSAFVAWGGTLIFAGLLVFYGWGASFGRPYSPISAAASIPLAWVYAIFPIGGALIVVLGALRFRRDLGEAFSARAEEKGGEGR